MEEYVKISRETYDLLNLNSRVLKDLMCDENIIISHDNWYDKKTFYTLAEESDFKSAIESKDVTIKLLRETIKKMSEVKEPEEKEGFWRSFATAIYRTPWKLC